MPMHPAPPDDRNGLLDAFEQTVQAIIDLGWACRDDDFDRPTELAGYTVKDQIAHVVGAEKALASIPRLHRDVPEAEQVVADYAKQVADDVERRRAVPGKTVVSELAAFHPERMEQLRRSELELDTEVGGPVGRTATFGQQLHARIVDAWCREQDLRVALDRPGDLDSAAAAVVTAEILRSLPRIVAREALSAVGHDVVLDVSGPVVAREGVRVRTGDDGRPFGMLLYSGVARPEGQEQHSMTTIHLTTEALTRRAAGRRSVDDIHYTVSGDEAVARLLLEKLAIAP